MIKKYLIVLSIIMLVTFSMISFIPVSADDPPNPISIGSITVVGGLNSIVSVSALDKEVVIVPGTDVTFSFSYSFTNLSSNPNDKAVGYCSHLSPPEWSAYNEDESGIKTFTIENCYPNSTISITLGARYYYNFSNPQVYHSDINSSTITFVYPENHAPNASIPSGNTHVVLNWPFYVSDPEYYQSVISDPDGNLMHYAFNRGNEGTGNSNNGTVHTLVYWTSNDLGDKPVYCSVNDIPTYEGQESKSDTSDPLIVNVTDPESDSNAYSCATAMSIAQGAAQAFKTDPLPIDFDSNNADAYGFFSDESNNDSIYDTFHCKELDDQNMTVDVSDSFYVCYSESLDMYFIDADCDHVFDATIDASSLENCTFGENPWEEQSKE